VTSIDAVLLWARLEGIDPAFAGIGTLHVSRTITPEDPALWALRSLYYWSFSAAEGGAGVKKEKEPGEEGEGGAAEEDDDDDEHGDGLPPPTAKPANEEDEDDLDGETADMAAQAKDQQLAIEVRRRGGCAAVKLACVQHSPWHLTFCL
jgi:hypothetical protein